MQWFEYLVLITVVIFIILHIVSFCYGINIYNSNVNRKFSIKKNFIFEVHDLKFSPNIMYFRVVMIFSLLIPFLIFSGFFQKDILSTTAGYYLFFAYMTIILYLIVFGLSFFVKPVNIKLFSGLILGKYLLILLSLCFLLFSCIFKINRLSLMSQMDQAVPYIVVLSFVSVFILFKIALLGDKKLYSWFIKTNSEENKINHFALFEWTNVLMLYLTLVAIVILYILL